MTEGVFDYKDFREKWDILLETKKYRQCEKLCHDGLAQSPPDKDRGKLYNHLGYLYENYLEDKTFDDILEHYVLSLQVDESNSNSHFNLANFLLEQGMQHLLRALELNDKHSKANKKLAQLSPVCIICNPFVSVLLSFVVFFFFVLFSQFFPFLLLSFFLFGGNLILVLAAL